MGVLIRFRHRLYKCFQVPHCGTTSEIETFIFFTLNGIRVTIRVGTDLGISPFQIKISTHMQSKKVGRYSVTCY